VGDLRDGDILLFVCSSHVRLSVVIAPAGCSTIGPSEPRVSQMLPRPWKTSPRPVKFMLAAWTYSWCP